MQEQSNNENLTETTFILYKTDESKVIIDVLLNEETLWLTQKRMAELFGVEVNTINYHIKEVYKSKELSENSTIRSFRIVQNEGSREVSREVEFYNLDVIISVGYRVNSEQATQFRIWATQVLKEVIIKGFTIDDERLKNGSNFGKDYFQELIEKIREIRASERRFYQKITDIYALSVDYDKDSKITKEFFATVQNKLHWAITGKTAAEIIYDGADAKKDHMGLKSWEKSPNGKIVKSDTIVAKNYLDEKHIKELEGIVSAYLDLAENRANRQFLMKMSDWVEFLNKFLELSDYPILSDLGKVSKLQAELKAAQEYDKFRVIQDKTFESDFDKSVKKYLKNSN